MECNYYCYCCQFWWKNQHYHKRSNHLLPIQTACQGVFWQRSKSISTGRVIYKHNISMNHLQKEVTNVNVPPQIEEATELLSLDRGSTPTPPIFITQDNYCIKLSSF